MQSSSKLTKLISDCAYFCLSGESSCAVLLVSRIGFIV